MRQGYHAIVRPQGAENMKMLLFGKGSAFGEGDLPSWLSWFVLLIRDLHQRRTVLGVTRSSRSAEPFCTNAMDSNSDAPHGRCFRPTEIGVNIVFSFLKDVVTDVSLKLSCYAVGFATHFSDDEIFPFYTQSRSGGDELSWEWYFLGGGKSWFRSSPGS